jgi:hypothetical protein
VARGGNFSSSNYLMGDISIAAPITISVWAKGPAIAANQVVVALSVYTGASANGIGIRISSSGKPTLIVDNAGSITSTTHANSTPTDTWYHLGGMANATDTRAISIDGVFTQATSGSNAITGSIAKLQTAALHWNSGANNLHAQYFTGSLAELAVWDVAFTSTEMLQLSKGLSPLLMRHESLVYYVPLIRGDASGNDYNWAGTQTFTETGTVDDVAHFHGLYRPMPVWVVVPGAASVAQDIDLDFVSSTEVVNSPTLSTSQEIALNFVSSTEVVNAISVGYTQYLDLEFVSSTEVVFALAHLEMNLSLANVATTEVVNAVRVQTAAANTTPAERKWLVEVEDRNWVIEAENRTWIIEGV